MGDKIGRHTTGQRTQAHIYLFQKGCFLERVLMYSSTKEKDLLIRLVSIHSTCYTLGKNKFVLDQHNQSGVSIRDERCL